MRNDPRPQDTPAPPWIDAGGGYQLTLDQGRLVCRNARGQRLASVPKPVREGPIAEQLTDLQRWLEQHARDCREQVEAWMLRSLPVPRAVLEAIWPDPDWRAPLENTLITALDAAGRALEEQTGFLRAVDPARGMGIVTLDGETLWLGSSAFLIPHPILLTELQDWRELAAGLELRQGLSQLLRETWARKVDRTGASEADDARIDDFSGGRFEMLTHALAHCRKLGYRVRGGYAVCRVLEAGRTVEARFWIGSDAPDYETETGELHWVDADEQTLPMRGVGPIAWSEGMRMASAIYAGRVVEKERDDD